MRLAKQSSAPRRAPGGPLPAVGRHGPPVERTARWTCSGQRGQGNPQSARALAITQAAVYDSVNAIDPTHTVYQVDARRSRTRHRVGRRGRGPGGPRRRRPRSTPSPADVAGLRRRSSTPRWPRSRTARPRTTASPWGSTSPTRSWPGGPTDGSDRVGALPHRHRAGPVAADPAGLRPTPAHAALAVRHPVRHDERRPVPPRPAPRARPAPSTRPPSTRSRTWASITSTTRTPEQTEIALFWAGIGASNAGVGIWNQIAQTVAADAGPARWTRTPGCSPC